ncbi:MAG TPA: hypothetical protein VN956_21300 [Pyrinomonadaceae bacterium]|nr:hypothetical protein [Pyrinomonadaceae bacterium]
MITERSATKAAGAQFDFLSRTIDNLDHECKTLITEATKDDERDIIAKTAFSEQVRLLTDQINSLVREPASGPSPMAMATARFSCTTGEG